MEQLILDKLREIEINSHIKILFACESGSRGWGFPSKDSDYDVRFIYQRKLEDYLLVVNQKDTMDFPMDGKLDLNGWDIKKFLEHIYKSNAVMFEWLQSPIFYVKPSQKIQRKLWDLSQQFFQQKKCINHYLGLTKNTYSALQKSPEVKLKKYFYILRPLLAAYWIQENKKIAPMELETLLNSTIIEPNVLNEINIFRELKNEVDESFVIPRSKIIDIFTEKSLLELGQYANNLKTQELSIKPINKLFYELTIGN